MLTCLPTDLPTYLLTYQAVLYSASGLFSSIRIFVFALCPIRFPGMGAMMHWHIPPALEDDETLCRSLETLVPPTAKFYKIPFVKNVIRFGMHVIYLALVSYVAAVHPGTETHSEDESMLYAIAHRKLTFPQLPGLLTLPDLDPYELLHPFRSLRMMRSKGGSR